MTAPTGQKCSPEAASTDNGHRSEDIGALPAAFSSSSPRSLQRHYGLTTRVAIWRTGAILLKKKTCLTTYCRGSASLVDMLVVAVSKLRRPHLCSRRISSRTALGDCVGPCMAFRGAVWGKKGLYRNVFGLRSPGENAGDLWTLPDGPMKADPTNGQAVRDGHDALGATEAVVGLGRENHLCFSLFRLTLRRGGRSAASGSLQPMEPVMTAVMAELPADSNEAEQKQHRPIVNG